jgi:hypothetical protein
MIAKLALLLIAAVVLAGAIGRWGRPPASRGNAIERARKCGTCGSYVVGDGPCPCGGDADGPAR